MWSDCCAGMPDKTPMTSDAAARVQASEAKASGGGVAKGGFAARAQGAAASNAHGGQGGQAAQGKK